MKLISEKHKQKIEEITALFNHSIKPVDFIYRRVHFRYDYAWKQKKISFVIYGENEKLVFSAYLEKEFYSEDEVYILLNNLIDDHLNRFYMEEE